MKAHQGHSWAISVAWKHSCNPKREKQLCVMLALHFSSLKVIALHIGKTGGTKWGYDSRISLVHWLLICFSAFVKVTAF